VFLANHTVKAVAEGKIAESKVDEALAESYTVLMRLGYFDGNPTSQKHFGMLGPADVCTKDHRDLALQAARQGIVLLKNDRGHGGRTGLPFARNNIRRLAIIGPNAKASSTMLGNYAGKKEHVSG
jgi:beta-D-xylosidase 4